MKGSQNSLASNGKPRERTTLPRWLVILLFLLPGLMFLPGIIGKIPYPSESALYNDLMLTHYPNALFLKRTILELHQIPLWSTLIHSGAPFAANPLSGLFYLPGWLALVFPLPEGISVLLAAHAVFAAWGMYLFLKVDSVGELSAIAGGLIFGLAPKLAAHYGAGHVTLIYAICWTPWIFWISRKDQQGWKTGIAAALLFLADPRWSVYAGLFWFTYDIAYRQYKKLPARLLYYLKAGITALLIASPLIIPMYEYIGLSTRTSMGLEDLLTHSMSLEKILGFLIPSSWGNPEWYIYPGGIVIGLLLIQFFDKQTGKKNKFWITWISAGVLIAFGSQFVDAEWITRVPIVSLLRVPSRAIFLVIFSLSVVSAKTIESLLTDRVERRILNKISFGLALLAVGLALSITLSMDKFSISLIWGFGFLLILSITLLLMRSGFGSKYWYWLLLGFVVLDLLGAGLQSYFVKEFRMHEQLDIIARISKEPGNFRIYSPSYSIPQWIAAEQNLEMADGVDPMQIAAYADFMSKASGIEKTGYSVTIPPFETGNPSSDNAGSSPDAFLLSLLNVKYVISDFEIDNPDLREIATEEPSYLYENTIMLARAWMEDKPRSNQDRFEIDPGDIHEIRLTPNKITISAAGPGRLVVSEMIYPGWRVFVDGERKQIDPAYGVLRSITIPDGDHEIEFSFSPPGLYIGILMSLIGWVISIWKIKTNEHD